MEKRLDNPTNSTQSESSTHTVDSFDGNTDGVRTKESCTFEYRSVMENKQEDSRGWETSMERNSAKMAALEISRNSLTNNEQSKMEKRIKSSDANTAGKDVHLNGINIKYDLNYLNSLVNDKKNLASLADGPVFKHVPRLIEEEIERTRKAIEANEANGDEENHRRAQNSSGLHGSSNSKVVLQEKVFIPIEKYPTYNFIGRILGPRGMTAKQLETECGCKIMIRGRGSVREQRCTALSRTRKSAELNEELHVLIECTDTDEERARQKMQNAVAVIRTLLIPPGNLFNQQTTLGHLNSPSQGDRIKQAPATVSRSRIFYPSLRPLQTEAVGHSERNIHRLQNFRDTSDVSQGQDSNSKDRQLAWESQMTSTMLSALTSFNTFESECFRRALANLAYGPDLANALAAYETRSNVHDVGKRTAGCIPTANLQQYITAAAMLNETPFQQSDGCGDGQHSKMDSIRSYGMEDRDQNPL